MASIKLKGDTSGEITISAPAVAGTTTLELPATSSTLATQNALGVRNLIINGDMRIDQRNGGATTGWAQGYVGIDRFRSRSDATITSSNVTYEQSTDVPSGQGFIKSMQLNCISAITSLATDARYSIEHRIEGNNFSHLEFGTANAKTFTFSFWVKSNVTGTYSLTFSNDDVSNLVRYMTTYTINSADTWEKKIITINGATTGNWYTDNGVGLSIQMILVAGSNYLDSPFDWSTGKSAYDADTSQVNFVSSTSNYFRVTGLQLEIGDTATPFEHRPYDMELQRCQRYFCKSYNIGDALGTNTWVGTVSERNYDSNARAEVPLDVNFPVRMRATPTLTPYTKTGTSGYRTSGSTSLDSGTSETTAITLHGSETNIRGTVMSVNLNAGIWMQFHYTANAEL